MNIKTQWKYILKLHFFPRRSPLDWKTPSGFLITFLSVVGAYYFVLLNLYQILGFFAGSCGLMINFVWDISNDLELLNIGGQTNQNDKNIRFNQLIKQHSDVKRLVNSPDQLAIFAKMLPFHQICR